MTSQCLRQSLSFRSREAAKKHHQDIHTSNPMSVAGIVAMHRPKQQQYSPASACPGCGYSAHQGGRRQCPAYNQTCMSCHKVGHFAKVCHSKGVRPPSSNMHQKVPQTPPQTGMQPADTQPKPGTYSLHAYPQHSQQQYLQLYTMQEGITEPAPTVRVSILSPTGQHFIDVFPDSEADICAARARSP